MVKTVAVLFPYIIYYKFSALFARERQGRGAQNCVLLLWGVITRKRENAKGVERKHACLFWGLFVGSAHTPQGATLLDLLL